MEFIADFYMFDLSRQTFIVSNISADLTLSNKTKTTNHLKEIHTHKHKHIPLLYPLSDRDKKKQTNNYVLDVRMKINTTKNLKNKYT